MFNLLEQEKQRVVRVSAKCSYSVKGVKATSISKLGLRFKLRTDKNMKIIRIIMWVWLELIKNKNESLC